MPGLSLPAGLPNMPMQTDLDVRGESGIGDMAPLLAAESIGMEDLVAVELRVRCLEARHGQIHPQVRPLSRVHSCQCVVHDCWM